MTAFWKGNTGLLAFGFLAAISASFGQTYFIALFSEPLRANYGLSHAGFGTVYTLATLTSAALMIQVGALIDRMDLRRFTLLVAGGLTLTCLFMAFGPTFSAVFLYLAILGLRFCGQGMLSHISATTMGRYFDRGRGRAVSVAAMGHPAGEAVFPILGVVMIGLVGWRYTWAAAAAMLALVFIPLMMAGLRGHAARHSDHVAQLAAGHAQGAASKPLKRNAATSFVIDALFFCCRPCSRGALSTRASSLPRCRFPRPRAGRIPSLPAALRPMRRVR